MNSDLETLSTLWKIFFSPNTKWPKIKEIYPQLMTLLKNRQFNGSDLSGIVNNKYEIISSEESFNNVVQYLLIVWVIIFIVGSISNGVVIFILTRVPNKSVYDIICVGLAVTDLIILVVVVPITTMWYSYQDYSQFSDKLCPFVNFIVYVSVIWFLLHVIYKRYQ